MKKTMKPKRITVAGYAIVDNRGAVYGDIHPQIMDARRAKADMEYWEEDGLFILKLTGSLSPKKAK